MRGGRGQRAKAIAALAAREKALLEEREGFARTNANNKELAELSEKRKVCVYYTDHTMQVRLTLSTRSLIKRPTMRWRRRTRTSS